MIKIYLLSKIEDVHDDLISHCESFTVFAFNKSLLDKVSIHIHIRTINSDKIRLIVNYTSLRFIAQDKK